MSDRKKRKYKDMIVIAMPAYGAVSMMVHNSIDRAIKYLVRKGIACGVIHGEGTYTHEARNNCVRSAFNSRGFSNVDGYPLWSHLFFVDSDMMFNEDLIYNLYKRNQDVVGGLYVQKNQPFVPNAGNIGPDGVNYNMLAPDYHDPRGIIQVDMVGTGLMMIKRQVFMKMKWPWFEFIKVDAPEERSKEMLTKYHGRTCEILGEDVSFCKKAKEAGFKIWLDLHNQGAHLGTYGYSFKDFAFANKEKIEEAREQMKNMITEGYKA